MTRKFTGDFEGSEAAYEQAISLQPTLFKAHSALAQLRRQWLSHIADGGDLVWGKLAAPLHRRKPWIAADIGCVRAIGHTAVEVLG